jgi:DNA helicase-2/ATP-dependent DNA helicase PcrA
VARRVRGKSAETRLTFQDFINLVIAVLGAARRPNTEQVECLQHDPTCPLLIVAGPGTGKTAVLVLRALRHVLVDRIPPEHIMITTFTRKAAKEIRTRLIEWGIPLIEQLLGGEGLLSADYLDFLRGVDINRFLTGTLDSLCEEALSDAREPNERPPVVIEAFAANQILARRGEIYQEAQTVGQTFKDYLGRYTLTGDAPNTVGDMTRIVRTLIDRLIQDEVDLSAYLGPGTDLSARAAIGRIFDKYREHLADTNQRDFAALERVFLDRLEAGRVPELLGSLRVLLIDEYQDTNPIQERIYFQLAALTGSSMTVVGDDDQSLYRFRGATIELFRDFVGRANLALGGRAPRLLYLTQNYRSTPEIVTFFNSFIQNDPDFIPARIIPPKPPIRPNQPSNRVPILGMFRDSADMLAADLASFLELVFRGGGWPGNSQFPEPIRCASPGGDFGDAVLLSSTVNEFTRPFMGNPPRPRLPWRLRQELQSRGVACFNPRGRALKDIPEVDRLLGLVLECLDQSSSSDPQGRVVGAMTGITNVARDIFRRWRVDADTYRSTNPAPVNGQTLRATVSRWQRFARDGVGPAAEWPLLDVFYSLIPWVPRFQDDPECQVYLEAISRCAAQAATFSGYRALILRDEPHRTRSLQSIVRDVLAPIADDLVEVDEDIMPNVPRDRLNLMTIHQAKGLEFPLVIVDIASDFTRNHVKQRFRRFPEDPSSVAVMEDDLSACTPIGALRTARSALQRSFEDLIRLYYVAYSRPQSVLMVVGCLPCLRYNTTIPHVATFWRRDKTWSWRRPTGAGSVPSLADELPFIPI